MAEIDLPRDAKDRVLRWLFEILRSVSLAPLGIDVPRPAAPLPADVLQVDVKRSATDALFRAEDGSILHVEFQMTSTPEDLRRFVIYDAVVLSRYEDAPRVHTVVLYGPRAARVLPERDFGSIAYKVHAVYLGKLDGEARLAEILEKVEANGRLEREDMLTLALVPLMRHERPLWQLLTEARPLFEFLPADMRDPLFGAMVVLGYTYEGEEDRTKLKEVLGLMSIGQEFIEDIMRDGEARGEVKASRLAVLEAIEVRFGQVPEAVRGKVEATVDLGTLRQWHRLALRAGSLQEVEQKILA
jgi:hypothetical protein